jgi:hypothetical protein
MTEGILRDPPDFQWPFPPFEWWPPFPWPEIWIVGIEVTQAIQYYHSASHLTDPADRGADNSVRLIARKPAWVRVYVRTSKIFRQIEGVTGTLVYRDGWGFTIFHSPTWQRNRRAPSLRTITQHTRSSAAR